jgi:hypothetical protein
MTAQDKDNKAQQPQREYIITEEQVQTVHHLFSIPDHAMDDADYMMQEEIVAAIRSHPHTPAPEHNELAERECAINNCMRKDWLERHDAATTRTAAQEARR